MQSYKKKNKKKNESINPFICTDSKNHLERLSEQATFRTNVSELNQHAATMSSAVLLVLKMEIGFMFTLKLYLLLCDTNCFSKAIDVVFLP